MDSKQKIRQLMWLDPLMFRSCCKLLDGNHEDAIALNHKGLALNHEGFALNHEDWP